MPGTEIKRVLFINPREQESFRGGNTIKSFAPPLGLATIAGMTPPEIEVLLVDENISPIIYNPDISLVAITVTTPTANRAYKIANEFRGIGVPVVLGGMHPTALSEEAKEHANAVVVGEAENVWQQLLDDLQKDRLQRIYHSAKPLSLDNLTLPRRDLFQRDGYVFPDTIYTTRGCPNGCNYCSVTSFFGRKYRLRPMEKVLEEVDTLPGRLLFFVDDNIAANPVHTKELFQGLKEKKKTWIGQASVTIGREKNKDLLKLAADSGCLALFLGIESLSPASLKAANKPFNIVSEYKDNIQRIHDHGIGVFGAFMFGLDDDGPDVFEKTVRFAQDTKIEGGQFSNEMPYPGTELLTQMADEGRLLLPINWSKYHNNQVVFRPKLMSVDQLREGRDWAEREFFSLRSIWKRVGLIHPNLLVWWALNLNYRRDDPVSQLVFGRVLLPLAKKVF